MIPIQDSVPVRYPPAGTYTLVGANVLIFLYQAALPARALARFWAEFALIPARYFGEIAEVAPATGVLDYLPFLSNTFLHGGWTHLILNMWTLWIFGPAVEDRLGTLRFFIFYLAAGIAVFWFMTQIVPGITSLFMPAAGGGIAWWAHIGGFVAGWILTPIVRRSVRHYRRFHRDEGFYGFLPDGRRRRGGRPWA